MFDFPTRTLYQMVFWSILKGIGSNYHPAQDHACKVKRSMAMRETDSLSGKRKMIEPTEEKRRHAPNAERDLQKHFSRLGLSLPVPIRKLEHILSDESSIYIEYLNPSDWLKMLVNKFPPMIAGGNSPLMDQLLGFWEIYENIIRTMLSTPTTANSFTELFQFVSGAMKEGVLEDLLI